MKKVSIYLTLFLICAGCLFKSVMKDEADDIEEARIYSYSDRKLLIMNESACSLILPQPAKPMNSKKSSQKAVRNSDSRFSVSRAKD